MFKLKPKNPTFFPIFILAVVILLFVVIAKSQILDFFQFPLMVSSNFISDIKAVYTYRFILDENRRLKSQLDTMKRDTLMINEFRLENERLRKILSLKERIRFTTVAACVIARDPNSWSSGIMVNKGRSNGVKAGDVVITELGLAGRVAEVSDITSKIMLINDPNSSVAAVVQRSREDGLVSGTLLGRLAMRYLEKNSDVAVGDAVLTSGLTSNYPEDILIGKIESIGEEQRGLSKYCLISPAVDLKRLEEVLIIVGRKVE